MRNQVKSSLLLSAITGLTSIAGAQSLSIDLSVLSATGGTLTDAKKASIQIGQTVVMGVYADITGNDYQALQDVHGSFVTNGTGDGRGDLSALRTAPFNSTASSNGTITDLDGDGDNDVSDFAARSSEAAGADNTYLTYFEPPTKSTDALELRIATLKFIATSSGGLTVNFVPSLLGTGKFYIVGASRNVYDDGTGTTVITYGRDTRAPDPSLTYSGPTTNVFTTTAGPTIVVAPEPSTLALIALPALALRRHRGMRK